MQTPKIEAFYDKPTGSWTYVVAVGTACAVIDGVLDFDLFSGRTGTAGVDKVIAYVRDKGLTCEWIIDTHIHADHLTAMAHLKKELGGKTGITRRVLDSYKLWVPFYGMTDVSPDGSVFDELLDDKEASFTIGGMPVTVMATPGHTPADTTFLIGDNAFVGDSLLMPEEGTGRCDFPGGSAADSWDSIQKLMALPDNTKIYVAHAYTDPPGYVATVADHKAQNIRIKGGVTRDQYIDKRVSDDKGKPVPKFIIPSLQVNLRAGVVPDQLVWPLNKL